MQFNQDIVNILLFLHIIKDKGLNWQQGMLLFWQPIECHEYII